MPTVDGVRVVPCGSKNVVLDLPAAAQVQSFVYDGLVDSVTIEAQCGDSERVHVEQVPMTTPTPLLVRLPFQLLE